MNSSVSEAGRGQGRRSASAWTAALGILGAGIAVARNILLVPFFLKYVSLAEYGAWLAAGGALTQLLLTDFGLAGVLSQRISNAAGAGEHERVVPLIASGLVAALVSSLGLSILTALLVTLLPNMADLGEVEAHRVYQCLLIAVLAGGLAIFSAMASGMLRSLQRPIQAGAPPIISDLVGLAATVALLVNGFGLYGLALGLALRSVVSAAWLSALVLRSFPVRELFARPMAWADFKPLMADAIRSIGLTAAMKVQSQASTFMVGMMLGSRSAGIYSLTVRAYDTVGVFLSQVTGALVPSLAHLAGSGDEPRFKAVMVRIATLLPLLAALGVLAVTVGNQAFVTLWVGSGKFGGLPLSLLAAAATWLSIFCYIAYDALYATGQFGTIMRAFFVSALIHIAILAFFLHWGLWVAQAAVIVSSLAWGIPLWIHVGRSLRLRGKELRSLASNVGTILLCASAIAAASLLRPVVANSWSDLVVLTVAASIVLLGFVVAINPDIRAVVIEEMAVTWQSLARFLRSRSRG